MALRRPTRSTVVDKVKSDNGEKTSDKTRSEIQSSSWLSTLLKWLLRLLLVVAIIGIAVVCAIGYLLITRLGFGTELPSAFRVSEFKALSPLLPESALEPVVAVPIPLGNIAVSKTGAVYFSFHPVYNNDNPLGVFVARVTGPSSYEAFPSLAFQSNFTSVLALRIDSKQRLWLLDSCQMGLLCTPSLYAFDLSRGEGGGNESPTIIHRFPRSVAGMGSFLNDFQIDAAGEFIYLTDTSTLAMTPGLVVYRIDDGTSRRVLDSHSSMFGMSLLLRFAYGVPHGGPLLGNLLGLKVDVDGLSLDRKGAYLYYSSVTSSDMYRVDTASLAHYLSVGDSEVTRKLMDANIPGRVVKVSSRKPVSDGQTSDLQGNVWLTAFCESSLAVLTPTRASLQEGTSNTTSNEEFSLRKVVQSDKLRWPDGMSFGPDGVYVTESALHLKLSGGKIVKGKTFEQANGPFFIYKISLENLRVALGEDYELPPAGQ